MKGLFFHSLLSVIAFPLLCHALTPAEALRHIKQLAPEAGVLLAEKDKLLLAHNEEQLYPAASCIKIPLALSAFNRLGENFRFRTFFYTDKENNLLIRGGGDPFLTSEEIMLIATNIKAKGWTKFNHLYLDDSLYQQLQLSALGTSDNPYDARLSSLMVNFNTMNLLRLPSGRIISAEPQTPTLPLAQLMKERVACCNKPTRINLSGKRENIRSYASQLIHAIFVRQGISIERDYEIGRLNKSWSLIYTHDNSKSLAQISRSLLLYSNNLIANALLLQFASDSPSPLDSSLSLWRADLKRMSITDFHLYEGSGLDGRNRFSPLSMHKVLVQFTPFIHSLPSDDEGAFYKTGTLTGVSNAAGYIKKSSRVRSFVIFSSQDSYKPLLAILKQVH